MSAYLLLAARIGLVLALYGFLGWALWLLWKDLYQQTTRLAAHPLPQLRLTLPGASGLPPTSYHFSRSEVILGRDPSCDFPLDDRSVSTRHACLAYRHNQWWAEDLSSTNGTFVNDLPVQAPIVLTSGDRIRCGSVMLEVEIGREP